MLSSFMLFHGPIDMQLSQTRITSHLHAGHAWPKFLVPQLELPSSRCAMLELYLVTKAVTCSMLGRGTMTAWNTVGGHGGNNIIPTDAAFY